MYFWYDYENIASEKGLAGKYMQIDGCGESWKVDENETEASTFENSFWHSNPVFSGGIWDLLMHRIPARIAQYDEIKFIIRSMRLKQ